MAFLLGGFFYYGIYSTFRCHKKNLRITAKSLSSVLIAEAKMALHHLAI